MARPDPQFELKLGGVWTGITSDVYVRDPIEIARGRRDEGARTDPGRCTFTLNNRSGKYSPRNPRSPYYGQLGRNTPVRVSVPGGEHYLRIKGTPGKARTPSSAALNISGDLDLRIDCALEEWRAPDRVAPGDLLLLMSRLDGSGSGTASYRLALTPDGLLHFGWSTTGVGTAFFSIPSDVAPTIPRSGRLTLRVTFDVNTGDGNSLVTFYTGQSLAGPWEVIGTPTPVIGTYVIANPVAPLEIGHGYETTRPGVVGRIYGAQVRNGINGPLVANPDFTSRAVGATAWTDSAGRGWTVVDHADISDRRTRFVGEVASWPSRWDVSGRDVYVPVEAAGIMRRLGQGARPLDSALRRQIPPMRPLAYWPMEDEARADRAASPIPGVPAMTAQGLQWAQADSLPSSAPLPVIDSSGGPANLRGAVPPPATPLTAWSMRCVYRHDTVNATQRPLLTVETGGSVLAWTLSMSGTMWSLVADSPDGDVLIFQNIATGPDLYKQWVRVELFVRQVGPDLRWDLFWIDVGGEAGAYGATAAGLTIGAPTAVVGPLVGYHADLDGLALGHISVWRTPLGTEDAYAGAVGSWRGETAGARAARLALEEDVQLAVYGSRAESWPMGEQGRATLLDLLGECADSDVGILYELRETIGLGLRLRDTLYSQPAALTLSYGEVAPPLEPVDDDQATRNDVTVTRAGGSSGRVVREDGPLSVLPPPDGVGLYAESVTRSLAEDTHTDDQAGWAVHLGTWDEQRYPSVHVMLHEEPDLVDAACAVDSGDRLVVTDLPPWLPPGDVDLMVQGYQEILTASTWDLTYTCTPYGPWHVAVADDTVYSHADTAGSVLAAAATSSQPGILVATTDGPPWTTDGAEAPWDITVGGEVMTVTAVANFADTYARTVAAGGWGTSSSGQAWSVIGGSGAAFSVGSSTGAVGLAALSTRHIATLAGTTCPDIEAEVTLVAPTVTVTGDGVTAGIAMRVQDQANHYHARLQWQVGGAVVLVLSRTVAGSRTNLASVTVGTYTAGQTWRIRARIQGSTIQARAWPTSSPDPVAWQATATDTAITAAGAIGLLGYLQPGNSNSLPVAIGYRSLVVHTPQTMTVTRSVEGVVKAHAAGTDVRLADPAYTAL